MGNNIDHIRNFSIIAHIDHGKSTLADRIINMCGGLSEREMSNQVLDSMALEKEKGITIKAQTVRLNHQYKNSNYQLNLIDTPGHVDFSYEVNRSLAACEGSILLIDGSQGIQAQTMANLHQALENNHKILLAINKIDLPSVDLDNLEKQIDSLTGFDMQDAIHVSGKTGKGVNILLDKIIETLPSPTLSKNNKLSALIIDSWYDKYVGVIAMVRVFSGKITKGMHVKLVSTNAQYQIENIGYFTPKKHHVDQIGQGQIGFINAKIKKIADCRVGDTIIEANDLESKPLKGFQPQNCVVFCGLYPIEKNDFENLKKALAKLHLNDASLSFEEQYSHALGQGFKCGFLGLLHLEIIQQRIDREFGINLITTSPSVVYKVYMKNNEVLQIHDPANFPNNSLIDHIQEPTAKVNIITPEQYLGHIISLCSNKRGQQSSIEYAGKNVVLSYIMPMNEIIFDFANKIKSISKGYASFDWQAYNYQKEHLVKLEVLVNGKNVDELSSIIHKSQAEKRGREIISKLKDLLPRQLFQIAIQAAIGGKIIARENISALKKNVTAKCYGGDISRKRKLIEKQKAGKKRMRTVGNVDIPQNAFIDTLKVD